MLLSEIKEVKELVDSDWREAVENMVDQEDDFEIDRYRFIRQDKIDEIQQEELSSDEYMLGCFNSWFLADVLEVDLDVVECMQKSECYEALGKMILSFDKLESLQEQYSSMDGYGHHFSHYDHSEQELGDYFIFRIN